jgi:rubredoxin
MDKIMKCPVCRASWDGGEMPEDVRHYFSPPYRWTRLVGIELPPEHPDHIDGVSFWQCPDCGTTWDRFTEEVVEDFPVIKRR